MLLLWVKSFTMTLTGLDVTTQSETSMPRVARAASATTYAKCNNNNNNNYNNNYNYNNNNNNKIDLNEALLS